MSGNPRKIDLMHKMFGERTGRSCGECSNLAKGRYHDKMLRKCSVYGLTHSEASDWVLRYEACGMFNQEYSGRPVIELVRHNGGKQLTDEEPLENQLSLI